MQPDELIRSILVRVATGPQEFSKIGTRNAMVIAVSSFGLALFPEERRVGTGIGSAAPTPRRAVEAESFVDAALDWDGLGPIDDDVAAPFRRTWSWLRRLRSTTCEARRATGSTRCRSWPVAPWAGPGTPTGRCDAPVRVTATVNGESREADDVWEGESLLYVLRERLGLPGSKNACEQGECGSCTVYLDGEPVCACLVAAGQAEGREVRTVEGLARGDTLDPVQHAFIDAGAVQCGFCTPGLVVAAHDLLERVPQPKDAEIREALAGNLCRCTGYEKILDAVHLAAAQKVG